jgi:DNA repair photolyase
MNKVDQRKVKQITNFIINNITLAEVSAMVIERATETAEFIVNNNLDPSNFESPVSRKKLHKKIKNFKEVYKQEKEEKIQEKWYNSIAYKLGLKKEEEKEESKPHKGFTTGGK